MGFFGAIVATCRYLKAGGIALVFTSVMALISPPAQAFSRGPVGVNYGGTQNVQVGTCNMFVQRVFGYMHGRPDWLMRSLLSANGVGYHNGTATHTAYGLYPMPSPQLTADVIENECGLAEVAYVDFQGADVGYDLEDDVHIIVVARPAPGADFCHYEVGAYGRGGTQYISKSCTVPTNLPPEVTLSQETVTVFSAGAVSVSGSAVDTFPTGDTFTMAWVQTGGPAVTFDATAATLAFTAPTLAETDPDVILSFELRATDTEGWVGRKALTVTVKPEDLSAPVIDTTALDYVLANGAATHLVDLANDITITDADPQLNVTYHIDGTQVSASHSFAVGATDVTITATDRSGHSATETVTVVVRDTQAPVVAPIADQDHATNGAPSATLTLSAVVNDNADPAVAPQFTINGSPATGPQTLAYGSYLIEVTAQDASGNIATPVNYTLTVTDGMPPVITAPSDITRSLGAAETSATVHFTASATDPEEGALPVSFWLNSSEITSPHDFPFGRHSVTVRATDSFGRQSDAPFVVDIQDTVPPVLTVPPAITAATDAGQPTSRQSFTATVLDNRGETIVPIYRLADGTEITSPHDFPIGTTQVSVQAADSNGNAASGDFTVTVADTEPPVMGVAPLYQASTALGETTKPMALPQSATDNSGETPAITYRLRDGTPIGPDFAYPFGDTEIFANSQDSFGNAATEISAIVRIFDGNPPSVNAPNIAVDLLAHEASRAIDLGASATDPKDGAVAVRYYLGGSEITSPHVFAIGTHSVEARATDSDSNTVSATFSVALRDVHAPVITIAPTLRADLLATGPTTAQTLAPVIQDASGAITPVFTLDGALIPNPHPYPVGTHRVRIDARDASGNSAAPAYIDVIISDVTAPVITAPPTIMTGTSGALSADVRLTAFVTDNSDAVIAPVFTLDGTEISPVHAFAVGGPYRVVVRATDASGNVATPQEILVTVTNDTPPSLSIPQDIHRDLVGAATHASVSFTASSADYRAQPLPVTFHLPDGSTITSPHTFPLGETVVTARAEDDRGLVAMRNFRVVLRDVEAPVIAPIASLTLFTAPGAPNAVANFTAILTDNHNEQITPRFTLADGREIASGVALPIGTHQVEVSAQDSFGNAATPVFFTIEVRDREAPILTLPMPVVDMPVTTQAGAAVNLADLVGGADNSGAAPTLRFYDQNGVEVSPNQVLSPGDHVFTVRAEDASGNLSAPSTITLRMADNIPPPLTLSQVSRDTEQRVIVRGQTDPGSALRITLPDGTTATITADPVTGAFTYRSPTAQPEGAVEVRAADAEGHISPPARLPAPPVDTVAPDPAQDIRVIRDDAGRIVVVGTAEPDATVEVTWPNGDVITQPIPDTGALRITAPDGMPEGPVEVVIIDGVGNRSTPITVQSQAETDGPRITLRLDLRRIPQNGALEHRYGMAEAGDPYLYDIRITFNEEIFGFELNDIAIDGGTGLGLTGSGQSYVLRMRRIGVGDITLHVPADRVTDASGNGNYVSNRLVIPAYEAEQLSETIQAFIKERSSQIRQLQPRLIPFVDGGQGGAMTMQLRGVRGQFALHHMKNGALWGQIKGNWSRRGEATSHYVLAVLGSHQRLGDHLIAGMMAQADHMRRAHNGDVVHGHGWLVGPYFAGRLAEHPLYFEARALWGRSQNQIETAGVFVERFNTDRNLIQARVQGDVQHATLTISPFLDLSHYQEDMSGFDNFLGQPVPAQGHKSQRVELGFEAVRSVIRNGARVDFGIGLSADGRRERTHSGGVVTQRTSRNMNLSLRYGIYTDTGGAFEIGVSRTGMGRAGEPATNINANFRVDF